MPVRQRIVIGMSGGVDSSVAAWLLKQQGHEVIGVFMKNWEDDDTDEYCTSRQDLVDAVSVADVIGIPIEAVNFASEYRERVFAQFLAEYSAGRTPNPDVLCNSEIKFRAFLDYALALGAERIATGHYASVREVDGRFELLKGADPGKDQSYFLHRLDQAQLSKSIFPLAMLAKREVRAIARERAIPVHAKRDSTGICFIGERPFREFLQRYLPLTPGEMRTPEGEVVGSHAGLAYYTLGQRQGLGIGGRVAGDGEPWFVAGKDLERNVLVVVQGREHPLLRRNRVEVLQAHWLAGVSPDPRRRYGAKTRYRQPDAGCTMTAQSGSEFTLSFDQAQWAPTPGQYAVVYDGDVCLGGGVIR